MTSVELPVLYLRRNEERRLRLGHPWVYSNEVDAANAALNGLGDRVRTVAGDAFRVLKDLAQAEERFDVVVIDPPAFIKRKKDLKAGIEAYQRLNRLAMRLVMRDGFLISSSCSYRLSPQMLGDLLWGSARHVGRRLQILEQGHQAPDHPIHPALPQSAYLKCITARVFQ